jgi:diguanylate cyclase (GGDEF)-like protein
MTMAKDIRILIVDDEPTVRNVLSQVLEDDGFETTEAANGEEALACLKKEPFSLVITDIMMPGMTGIELLVKIKQLYPDTQVIIITSYASLDTALTALRQGAYDYLFKPFEDLSLISAATARAIEKVRLISENQKLLEELKGKNEELKKANRILKEFVSRDGLTGLFNHRHFQDLLSHEVARSTRYERIFSMLFIDLDYFKQYNDTHGHLDGDDLLRAMAICLKRYLRKSDILARYGGEEFTIILPSTSKKDAQVAAEKIRRFVEEYPFQGQETQPSGNVTISIGVSTFPDDGSDAPSIVNQADKAMYQAKNSGRNRVCVTGNELNELDEETKTINL